MRQERKGHFMPILAAKVGVRVRARKGREVKRRLKKRALIAAFAVLSYEGRKMHESTSKGEGENRRIITMKVV